MIINHEKKNNFRKDQYYQKSKSFRALDINYCFAILQILWPKVSKSGIPQKEKKII